MELVFTNVYKYIRPTFQNQIHLNSLRISEVMDSQSWKMRIKCEATPPHSTNNFSSLGYAAPGYMIEFYLACKVRRVR